MNVALIIHRGYYTVVRRYKFYFLEWQNNILRTSEITEITEITSSINSRVRLWKINHSVPGCSFYKFYEWYIFQ